jgi:HK97 family phage major capsid protein
MSDNQDRQQDAAHRLADSIRRAMEKARTAYHVSGGAIASALLGAAVRTAYRARGTWTMNSATAGAIRKLKDGQGRYLWTDSLAAGQPNMLLGYPVAIWEQMQDIATNAFPVAFGDWRRAYLLLDRTDIRITVDANITTPGRIKFFVRRREGGCVLNNAATKWLRTTLA